MNATKRIRGKQQRIQSQHAHKSEWNVCMDWRAVVEMFDIKVMRKDIARALDLSANRMHNWKNEFPLEVFKALVQLYQPKHGDLWLDHIQGKVTRPPRQAMYVSERIHQLAQKFDEANGGKSVLLKGGGAMFVGTDPAQSARQPAEEKKPEPQPEPLHNDEPITLGERRLFMRLLGAMERQLAAAVPQMEEMAGRVSEYEQLWVMASDEVDHLKKKIDQLEFDLAESQQNLKQLREAAKQHMEPAVPGDSDFESVSKSLRSMGLSQYIETLQPSFQKG